ncbi:MAG: hypothetical protein E7031_01040 [Akkermansiaceae bacterium]|nr:hypothetical protein [Akkermansiaceae bacterium]
MEGKKPQNELIIGLGGCGGRSIKEFRRTVEMRAKDYKYITDIGTKIDYLYIDSNNDILGANDWTVFGKNIRLEPNQIIELKQSGVTPDIDEISSYPNVEPWIGDIKDSFRQRSNATDDESVQRTLQTMHGAGQLRRYGRALFSMHSAAVRTTLRQKIDDLVTGRDNEVTFRIFCTLGGGTGSGSLIDMITLIQSLCQSMGVRRSVIVYAYVAASRADGANAGSFYENEYCSLRDLNALMVGSYHPMVTGMPFNDARDSEFNLPTPVNRVYISSDLAPGTPELRDQVKSVTAACFDSIVYAHSYQDPNCLRAISDEDLVDVTPGEPNSRGRIVRSYRFSVLGSRRWSVPTTQIRELLNCETEVRVWDSLLHGNKLPDGTERDISVLEGFRLGFTQTETSDELKKLEVESIQQITALYEEIKTQNRRDERVLTDLRAKAEEFLASSKKLHADQNRRVRLIDSYKKSVNTIERSLLEALDNVITWDIKPSVWGLKDVQRYLAELRRSLINWHEVYVPNSSQEDIEKERGIICDIMQEREEQWLKLGVLTIQFTKLDERMIEAQYADSCSMVFNGLKEFKRMVLSELIKKIDDMIRRIEASLNTLISGIESTRASAEQLVTTLSHELQAHTSAAKARGMRDMYAYDDNNLRAIRNAMAEQDDLHVEEMKNYTDALKKAVGDGERMILCNSNTAQLFVNDLRTGILNETMERIHDRAVNVAALQSVLVGNIIDRLAQIGTDVPANWEHNLGPLVEQFMRGMPISAEINGNDGLRQPQVSPAAAIVVGLPETAQNPALLNWLEQKIRTSRPNTYIILGGRMEFYKHHSPEEIRVLYVPYWMPCRFAGVSSYVEGRYQSTLEENDRAKIYFANYDATGEDGSRFFNRPALTLGGEPDERNISTTELMSELFIRVKGKEEPMIMKTTRGVEFARDVDKYDGINYTNPYTETQIRFPGQAYKNDMMRALRMAVRESTEPDLYVSMTLKEKEAVYMKYSDKLAAEEQGSEAWLEAREKRDLVRRLLEL